MTGKDFYETQASVDSDPRTTRVSANLPKDNPSGFTLSLNSPPNRVDATSRYKVVSELGKGGMGIVYRARDLDLQRDVALKILLHEYLDRPELADQFTQEARIIGSLQHPGIAQVYECGQTDDGRPFHSMKLVEGSTFLAILRQQKPDQISLPGLLNIYAQVCKTMAYTHSQGVIHLDLKPTNVMIGAFGEVHVMDWGLARRLQNNELLLPTPIAYTCDELDAHSESRCVRGTLEFMAPEQAHGRKLDERTDVFSLGGLLCEILTGRPTYWAKTRDEKLRMARNAELAPAFRRLDQCDASSTLVRLAKRCIQSDPAKRPQNAADVASEIDAFTNAKNKQVEDDMTHFFELSQDLFCIAGFDGYFRRINDNFSRVLGYSRAELLERPFLDLVVKEDHEKTTQILSQLVDGQPVVQFQNRYKTKTGDEITFEWTAKPLPDENVIFAIARNVTH